jgi:hypothetical protein
MVVTPEVLKINKILITIHQLAHSAIQTTRPMARNLFIPGFGADITVLINDSTVFRRLSVANRNILMVYGTFCNILFEWSDILQLYHKPI